MTDDSLVSVAGRQVPRVSTTLGFADHLGAWKSRWGIGRLRYRIEPGLYAVGSPTPESPVLVSANYKMSFDRLRSPLAGLSAWILVLDTNGINVWCAAGKGTFGTDEIVRRVEAVELSEIVSHKKLVLPQLGAPGVNMHEVKRRSGFRVVYGPVRAQDVPAFLAAGMRATPEMRRVNFPFRDRVVLIPLEIIMSLTYVLIATVLFFLLAGVIPWGYSFARAGAVGMRSTALILSAVVAGTILAPALLPWIPGRSFSAKGAWMGLLTAVCAVGYAWFRTGLFENWLSGVAWFFMIPAAASFLALNFTGASTYTSLSGVRREMRIAVPLQVVCGLMGVGLWLAGRFV